MTGRLVDMSFTLGGKQRITLEVTGRTSVLYPA